MGLTPMTITRLTSEWEKAYEALRKREFGDRDYLYVLVDGVHFNIRLEDERPCTLLIVGARADGTKDVISVEDSYREITQIGLSLLRDLKMRWMQAPVDAVGDGALGLWKVVAKAWPETKEQRCWLHRLGNVLGKLPKRLQAKAKRALDEIIKSSTRAVAENAIEAFVAGQKSEGGSLAAAGPGQAAHTFSLPGRALDPPAYDEPGEVAVQHRAPAAASDEGSGITHEGCAPR